MDKVKLGLLGLFIILSSAWLGTVPGLMGDEGSEGENVYELQEAEEIVFIGERSYIGPLMDYVRVPFVNVFGYTTLALRIPMFVISVLTYLLAVSVLERTFGKGLGLMGAVVMAFSPIYLTQQRLGWAITLLPFWAFMLLWVLDKPWRYKHLVAGVVAGVGVHSHILFLPTAAAVAAVWWVKETRNALSQNGKHFIHRLLRAWGEWWPALVGFWAAFGTQMIVLQLFKDDQGDPGAVAELMGERWQALPGLLQVVVSGSSYIARYTGQELPAWAQLTVVAGISIGIALAVILPRRRWAAMAWLGGLAIHTSLLLYMIDRFTLRYFVVLSLGMWALAGVGYGKILKYGKPQGVNLGIGVAAIAGALLFTGGIMWPFLRTGGSTNDFSLGNRTNSAADLVDVRPLVQCIAGRGAVGTENIHIYNRLLYLSHENPDIVLVKEDEIDKAKFKLHYRDGKTVVTRDKEACPDLQHFIVEWQ